MNHKNARLAKLWTAGERDLGKMARALGLPDVGRVRQGLETLAAAGEVTGFPAEVARWQVAVYVEGARVPVRTFPGYISERDAAGFKDVLDEQNRRNGSTHVVRVEPEPRIPALEPHCGSWIVVRRATGEVVGEFFDKASVERFDPAVCEVRTAQQHLAAVNRALKTKK